MVGKIPDRRRFLIGSAASLAAASIPARRAAAQGAANVRYLTPFGYLIDFAEAMYAETGGFFKREGLEVEIMGGRGSAMSVQQVLGGNVLLSRTGGTDHIKAYAKDPALVAIGEIVQRDIFFVISHADRPLKSPRDLAGKTIGVVSAGGATENLLDMMLAATGIPAGDVQRQPVGNAPTAFEFVKQGRIAGYIATTDTVFQLKADKQPIAAWSTDDHAPCPGQVYITSRANVEKSGDQLAKFLRGVHACMGAMLAAKDLAPIVDSMMTKYEVVEAKRPDKGVAVLRYDLEQTYAPSYRDKLASAPEHWTKAYDLMVKAKIVQPLDKRDFYDDRVRRAAFG
jgi:ABC-type nitrate/sulfonate/bicarbonate transport system substrate-binding protein